MASNVDLPAPFGTDEAGQGAAPHLDGDPGDGVHATEITGHVDRAQHHALIRFNR